jgi:tetratricopeptide (TPR) repeat protein
VAKNPRNARAQSGLGNALAGEKRYAEAVGAYRAAVGEEQGNLRYRYHYVLALLKTGELMEARRQLEQLDGLDAESMITRYGWGLLHFEKREWEAAEEALLDALVFSEQGHGDIPRSFILSRIVHANRMLTRYDRAVVFLQRMIVEDPANTNLPRVLQEIERERARMTQ